MERLGDFPLRLFGIILYCSDKVILWILYVLCTDSTRWGTSEWKQSFRATLGALECLGDLISCVGVLMAVILSFGLSFCILLSIVLISEVLCEPP
jgi:hypothetical protein